MFVPVEHSFTNITITAPIGTSQHNQYNFLCLPATWATILSFFVANYLAHAFTIWRRPGEKTSEYLFACFLALIFPISGLGRGIDAIYRAAVWTKSPLRLIKGLVGLGDEKYELLKAAKAGGLGIVFRDHSEEGDLRSGSGSGLFEFNDRNWEGAILQDIRTQPIRNEGDGIAVLKFEEPENPMDLLPTRNISGVTKLHQSSSYGIMELSSSLAPHIKIFDANRNQTTSIEIALPQSSSIAPVLFALIQVIYATYGLVRNSGDEFEQYGYAFFSLSVIPYISMSIINLLGNLLTPSYSSITLIGTSTMREARGRGNLFLNPIGEISTDNLYDEPDASEIYQNYPVIVSSCSGNQDNKLPDNPEAVTICFGRNCAARQKHSLELLVPGGGHALPPIRARKDIFKLFGLISSILPYILCLDLVPPSTSTATVQRKAIIIIWTIVDYLAGLYLLWSRTGFSEFWTETKLFWKAVWRKVTGKGRVEKEEEYLEGRLGFSSVFVICVLGGGVAAGFYFYLVVDEMLEFGACRVMSG